MLQQGKCWDFAEVIFGINVEILGFIYLFLGIDRAYDRAAIKFRGVDADINFNVSDYDDDIKQVRNLGFFFI